MPTETLLPALFGHSLRVMQLTKFAVMLVNETWIVMPDWNKVVKAPWVFNPLYNTSLVRKHNV
jgi:hypothetical protein